MLLETGLDQDNDPIVYLTDKNGIWSFHKLCDLIAKTFLGYVQKLNILIEIRKITGQII